MAPPRKRRRMTEYLPSENDMALFEPRIPTFSHSVSDIKYTSTHLPTAQTTPQHVQEVHLHIQKRSVALEGIEPLRLERRQLVSSLLTTVDAAGSTIVSVVTSGLDAGAATSTTPTPAAPSTTAGAATSSSTTQHTHVASTGKVSLAAQSSNSTSTGKGTAKTTLPRTYLATLTNGKVRTITRSPTPYVTTFAHSQVSTICNRSGQCRLKGTKFTKSTRRGRESPKSPIVTTSSAAAFAGGTAQSTLQVTSTSTAIASQQQNSNSNNTAPPLATIAGGVVGGAAGLAVILIGILILLRWYKRKLQLGQHTLTGSESPGFDHSFHSSAGQSGMAERTGLSPLVNAMPAFFRHQDKSQEDSLSSERGFEKISGRKLPSVWSEGVERSDTAQRRTPPDRRIQGIDYASRPTTTSRRDSTGFYNENSTHYSPSESPEPQDPPGENDNDSMTLSPGPQRRPTLHEPGPYTVFPRPTASSASLPQTPPAWPLRDGPPRRPSVPSLSPFEGDGGAGGGRSGRSSFIARSGSETPSTVGADRSSRFTEDF